MPELLRLVLRADGTPNLPVLVPSLIVVLVVGGLLVALVRAKLGAAFKAPLEA